jgi:hypothetical protein
MTELHHRMQHGLPGITQDLWEELDRRWGTRILGLQAWGDAAHRQSKSDHNTGYAIDVMTRDVPLQDEVVSWALLPTTRTSYRVSLVISRRRKWSAATKWRPAQYLGVSPHTDHVHISVRG